MKRQKSKLTVRELMDLARGETEHVIHEKDCGDYIMQTTDRGERMVKKTDNK